MADNYLEKQYERYEARKAAWEKARKLGRKKAAGGRKASARTDEAASPQDPDWCDDGRQVELSSTDNPQDD